MWVCVLAGEEEEEEEGGREGRRLLDHDRRTREAASRGWETSDVGQGGKAVGCTGRGIPIIGRKNRAKVGRSRDNLECNKAGGERRG